MGEEERAAVAMARVPPLRREQRRAMKKLVIALSLFLVILCSCVPDFSYTDSQQVEDREVYIPQNSTEFDNYNRRQQVADDPTTLLWCTFFPPTVGQEPFTVPIVGKLTSSGKLPIPTEQCCSDCAWGPELPGPDGMYGENGEYLYGFTPAGYYVEFTDLPSFCTTQPTIWQRNETRVVFGVDPEYANTQERVRELLQIGDANGAASLLEAMLAITETIQ